MSPLTMMRAIALVLGLAGAAAAWMMLIAQAHSLPNVVRLDSVTLRPDAETPVILGRDVLAQGDAGKVAQRHLAVVHGPDGISAYDIAPDKKVGVYTLPDEAYKVTGRLPLPEGDTSLWVGDVAWNVTRKEAQVTLSRPEAEIRLSGAGVAYTYGKEMAQVDPALWERGQALLRGHATRFYLGGPVEPDGLSRALGRQILPDPRLPLGAATLLLTSDGWQVERTDLPVAFEHKDGRRDDVDAHPILLVDADGERKISHLILGRTIYALGVPAKNTIRLTPVARHVWLPEGATIQTEDPRITARLTDARPRFSAALLEQVLVVTGGLTLGLTALAAGLGPGRAPALAAAGVMMTLSPLSGFSSFLGALGAGLATLALVSGLLAPRIRPDRTLALGGLGALMLGAMALGLRENGPDAAGASVEYQLAGAWLGLMAPLAASRMNAMGTAFWAGLATLAAIGTVAAARLVALDPTDAWMELFEKHLFALAAIGLAAALALDVSRPDLWPAPMLRRCLLPRARNRGALALASLLGLGIAAVTLLGDETGYHGIFQPSELAKSLLVLLVAATVCLDLARRQMLTAQEGALSLAPPVVAIAIALAIGVASAVNYDMSPIIVCILAILAALTAGTSLHLTQWLRRARHRSRDGLPIPRKPRFQAPLQWRHSRRLRTRWSSFWPLAIFGLVCCLPLVLWLWLALSKSFAPGTSFDGPGYLLTPWTRVQSQADMALGSRSGPLIRFPEAGTQLKLGRLALLDARCRLGRPDLCPVTEARPEPDPQALLRVPAVQDDFASVSLVQALGPDGALLYAAGQVALIVLALGIGVTALLAPAEFRIGAWLSGCSTIGLATMVAAQFAVPWANALGLLPIMGQPMTFVSLGASHHLGVALPFAVVTVLTCHATRAQRTADTSIRHQIQRRRLLK